MSKNIKEIGKELLGKSLNSFHRKTGLTQLEKNNEMQDGILDGILSQVDDAYIEKTEQSNVIHLEGSGDGVVVLDGIEGNTLVNLIGDTFGDSSYYTKNNDGSINIIKHDTILPPFNNNNHRNLNLLKPNTTYTLVVKGEYTKITALIRDYKIENGVYILVKELCNKQLTSSKTVFRTGDNKAYIKLISSIGDSESNYPISNLFISVLEGDYSNKEINYSEGLQSSFEEKVNDESKYEIEILSNNRNLVKNTDFKANSNGTVTHKASGEINVKSTVNTGGVTYKTDRFKVGKEITFKSRIRVNSTVNGTSCTLRIFNDTTKTWIHTGNNGVTSDCSLNTIGEKTLKLKVNLTESNYKNGDVLLFYVSLGMNTTNDHSIDFDILKDGVSIELGNTINSEILPHKQNKIKVLINEPLRSVPNGVKDRLYVKNNKLVVERNCKYVIINGSEGNYAPSGNYNTVYRYWCSTSKFSDIKDSREDDKCICDNNVYNHTNYDTDRENINIMKTGVNLKVLKSKVNSYGSINDYLIENPIKCIYQLEEPYYEEVLNEYGEPIILEGYENGTLYIDSTVIPTTTVRYTPKMESFKTLKEVNKNNNSITLDINENIIPYMMDVDYIIMEKELCLLNTKNIRKMEELDMTSMQKRTQDMLERLIKGKTLTEQECKTRVTTYLNAGKITDEQAEELMLVISEVYA